MSAKQFDDRIDMLNDAISYFWGKPERRCIVNDLCSYVASDTSEGCAIGRLLDKDVAENLKGTVGAIFKQLPEWMQGLGIEFICDLQHLHDENYFVDMMKGEVNRIMQHHVDTSLIVYPESVENE